MSNRACAILRRLAAAILCLCLLPWLPGAEASGKTLRVSFAVTTYQNRARELLRQLNAYRAANGREALAMTADLESAAIQRASELFVHFDHQRPALTDYDTVFQQYASLGGYLACAESVSAGQSKAADALDAWKGDASGSLLDADFTHAGIACVYLKDSYHQYYWALLLTGQPESFKGKAAADSAKAGKTKNVSVEIAPGMFKKADDSHDRFELRANNLNLKTKQTATPTVNLYDRRGVKIGKCQLDDLSFKSGNTGVFTVSADGTVRRKKVGTGTLTISFTNLSSAKCTVTIGSGSSGSASGGSNSAAVTSDTIGQREPELSVTEYSKTTKLSVYVRGASGYVLYRSSSKGGSYAKVTEKATTKRWDYSLDNEDISKAYYYKVRAYKNAGGKRVYSEYSDPVRVAP